MASHLAQRAAAIRQRYAGRAAAVEGTAIEVGSGLIIGSLERGGKLPVSVMGLPSKLGLGIGAMLIGAYATGATGRVARHVGDAFLTCYAYAAGKSGAIIAGTSDFLADED